MTRARLLALAVSAALACPALAQVPLTEGRSRLLGDRVSFAEESGSQLVHWSRDVVQPGSQFIRIRFEVASVPEAGDLQLTVRNRAGRAVFAYSREELARKPRLITPVIPGGFARLEVTAAARPRGLVFTVAELFYQQTGGTRFSTVDPDEREPIVAYRRVQELSIAARSVAKLQFVRGSAPLSCTGFMVSPSLMLTNQHCISQEDECESGQATFGFQVGDTGDLEPGEQRACRRVVVADRELDFSLLELDGAPGRVWGVLPISDRDAAVGEQAYLIQHPNGEPKQISRKGCTVSTAVADGRAKETDLGHVCDTATGSSGAPLLGRDFKVIALHHFGFEDGGRWTSENRAVRMRLILSTIKPHL